MMDLIKKWQKGDKEAFETLFQQYRGLVFRNALLITGSSQEAEDILQQVFLAVWKSRHSYNPRKGKFTNWLHRIIINQCIDNQRSKKQEWQLLEKAIDSPELDSQVLLENAIADKLERERLINIVNNMDKKHSSVLVLRYFNDLSYREIADILSIPIGTVKSRICTAIRYLRNDVKSSMLDEGT